MPSTFQRSLSYLQPYRWLAIGSLLSTLIVTACGLLIPSFFQKIIDDGISAKNMEVIKYSTLVLITVAIVRAICSFINTYWSAKASQGIAYDLRNDMYKKLEYLEFSFHDKHNIGQLVTRATSDVEAVRNFFATGLFQILAAIITLIGSIIILASTQLKLFLIVSLILPLIILIFVFMFRKLGPVFGKVQKNLGILNNILQENIMGIRIVKIFTAESHELEKYTTQNQKIYDENINVIHLFSNGFPFIFFLSNLATLAVIWIGGNQVISDTMTIGTLVAFNSYLTFLVQPIFQLGFVLQQSARSDASAKRIFSIMDVPNTLVSKPNAKIFQNDQSGEIVFENVCFSYVHDTQDFAIRDITIKIPSGSTVAFLGPTGSGKSSIVELIPRYYDITSGHIYIDNIDVRDYELDSLREHIGVVLQDIRLKNGTIRENIIYGKPNATDEEINRVCELSHVTDFLNNIEGGLDFEVGESGKNLSGGQRQRIALARVFLVNPKILILDDAMSALDAKTEYDIKVKLEPYKLSKKYTAIFITQKVSTVKDMDIIFLVNEGKIIGQGTHEELLRSSKYYQELIQLQNEENEQDT